jgi:xanthosine phosphorylase
MTTATKTAIQAILDQHAPEFRPKIGIILGSGLSSLAAEIANPIEIPYHLFPNVPKSTVEGHAGCFVLGTLKDCPVICMNGRLHHYEGVDNEAIKTVVRVFSVIGVETLLITNASGSLREDIPPGNLMLISDHMNFSGNNPLIGPNDDEFGPRFFPMENAYDAELRKSLLDTASSLEIPLKEGVYIGVAGPNFESPAEIQAFRTLGADAVGMSTVPEVLIARHCGMKVTAIATSTNFAAGMSEEVLSHEGTLRVGKQAASALKTLLSAFVEKLYG